MAIRKTLFWIHLGTGLSALVPMAFLSLTGILLAFEPQLTREWTSGTSTLRTRPHGVRRPLDELVATAMGSDAGRITSIAILADSTAYVELREAKRRFVRVDPWTGEVQARTGALQSFLGTVESLHQNLASGSTGRIITGSSALACALLSIGGLAIWWPRKLASARNVLWPRRGLRGRTRDWQWHNAFGFLAFVPLLVLGVTGSVMAFPWAEKALLTATASHEPERIGSKAAAIPSVHGRAERHWQDWLDTATAHAPSGWTALRLRAPEKSGKGPVVNFRGSGTGPTGGNMLLSPDGSFLSFTPAGTDLGHRLRAMVGPLHTGVLLGIPGQLIIVFGALAALVLAWTGCVLSWRRFFH